MDTAAAIALAEAIVTAIVKVAPSIEQGIVSALPYEQAIAGIISGSNATMDEIVTLLTSANIASAQFQTPLPPDDGATTT